MAPLMEIDQMTCCKEMALSQMIRVRHRMTSVLLGGEIFFCFNQLGER